jgi:hypothetical protein
MTTSKIVINSSEQSNVAMSSKNIKVNKPNENSGVNVSTHIKISDPNTGEVLVQKRGDL